MTTTVLHPQTNGQLEKYNKTLVSRHWLYIVNNQQNWDMFLKPLTYAYNCYEYSSANEPPFSLTLSGNPPGPPTVINPSTLSDDQATAANSKILRQRMLHQVSAVHDKVSKKTKRQRAKNKRYFGKKLPTLPTFQI